MKTKSFKDLIVWQKAYRLVLEIYKITKSELETQYLLATDLKYINKNEVVENLLKEVGCMLYRMLNPKRYPLYARRELS